MMFSWLAFAAVIVSAQPLPPYSMGIFSPPSIPPLFSPPPVTNIAPPPPLQCTSSPVGSDYSGLFFEVYDSPFTSPPAGSSDNMIYYHFYYEKNDQLNRPVEAISGIPIFTGTTSKISVGEDGVFGVLMSEVFIAATVYGYFVPNISGDWVLALAADDVADLYFGDKAICGFNDTSYVLTANWVHGTQTTVVNLNADQPYPIRVVWGNGGLPVNLDVTFIDPNGVSYVKGEGINFILPSQQRSSPPNPSPPPPEQQPMPSPPTTPLPPPALLPSVPPPSLPPGYFEVCPAIESLNNLNITVQFNYGGNLLKLLSSSLCNFELPVAPFIFNGYPVSLALDGMIVNDTYGNLTVETPTYIVSIGPFITTFIPDATNVSINTIYLADIVGSKNWELIQISQDYCPLAAVACNVLNTPRELPGLPEIGSQVCSNVLPIIGIPECNLNEGLDLNNPEQRNAAINCAKGTAANLVCNSFDDFSSDTLCDFLLEQLGCPGGEDGPGGPCVPDCTRKHPTRGFPTFQMCLDWCHENIQCGNCCPSSPFVCGICESLDSASCALSCAKNPECFADT